MDAAKSCTTFLLIRLKLNIPEENLLAALLKLCGTDNKNDIVTKLLTGLSKAPKLENAFNTRLTNRKNLRLSKTELALILSHSQRTAFSQRIQAQPERVDEALCELIPFIIQRFQQTSLLEYDQAMELDKDL